MKNIFHSIGKKRKITVKLIRTLLINNINREVPISTIRYLLKKFLKKSWQRLTTTKFCYENEVAERNR